MSRTSASLMADVFLASIEIRPTVSANGTLLSIDKAVTYNIDLRVVDVGCGAACTRLALRDHVGNAARSSASTAGVRVSSTCSVELHSQGG